MLSTKLAFVAVSACLIAHSAAYSAEPSGCDMFAWPLAKEQELLRQAQPGPVAGTEINRDAQQAILLKLTSIAEAKLPVPPERAPKNASSFAGFVQFDGAHTGGVYKVSLSEEAWIDVIQGGRYLKPAAFTGATDCPNIRKSVKFLIRPGPFIIQLSDAPSNNISIVVTLVD
jgi:hypothetical protein